MKPPWGWHKEAAVSASAKCRKTRFRVSESFRARLYVMADGPYRDVTVSAALKREDPEGRWWLNGEGYLERPANLYEVLRLDEGPPFAAWTLTASRDEVWRLSELQNSLPKKPTETAKRLAHREEKLKEFRRLQSRYYYWRDALSGCSLGSTRYQVVQGKLEYCRVAAREALAEAEAFL